MTSYEKGNPTLKMCLALYAICLSISLCHAGKVRLSIDLNQFDPDENIKAQVQKKFSTEELALQTSLFFKQPNSMTKKKYHTRANRLRLDLRTQGQKESILEDFLGVFLKDAFWESSTITKITLRDLKLSPYTVSALYRLPNLTHLTLHSCTTKTPLSKARFKQKMALRLKQS